VIVPVSIESLRKATTFETTAFTFSIDIFSIISFPAARAYARASAVASP
jgi:hypothetical protein